MLVEEFLTRIESAPGRLARVSYRDELDLLAHDACRMIEGNFTREEDSDGNPWPAHSPVTIARHGPHDLLRLSYDMFHAAVDPENPNSVMTVTDRDVTFGISGAAIPYANIQNEGGRNIPQREYFYLRERDREAILELFQRRASGRFFEAILG